MRYIRTSVFLLIISLCTPFLYADNGFTIKDFNPAPHTSLDGADNNKPLRFGILGDHTGGGNPDLWKQGLDILNKVKPDFAITVGDMIEGRRDNDVDRKAPSYKAAYRALWDDFDRRNSILNMPFFYTPGNHDYWNREQAEVWQERYGPSYYSFIYKDVLFVVLNTAFIMKDNSDPKGRHFDNGEYEQQLYWLEKTLKKNTDVKWTFIIQHHPFWSGFAERVDQEAMWKETEQILLEDNRPYTVIAGHVHRYTYNERFGRDYITLAPSGTGGSGSVSDGNFNQVTIVTMKQDRPEILNILYDGTILDKKGKPLSKDKADTPKEEGKPVVLKPRPEPVPPAVENPYDLISNPSFETAGFNDATYPEGWFISNPEYTRSNEDANTGEWSLRLKTDKPVEPVIHQAYIVKGAYYKLTAAIKITKGSTGTAVVDTWDVFDDAAEFSCTEDDADEWVHMSATFSNNTDLDRIFIRCFAENFSGTCYFDDVSLTQISEPFPALNDAGFISQNIPSEMKSGETRSCTVQMENTGVETWTDDYVLTPISETWKPEPAEVPVVNMVTRETTYTFTFNLKAPSKEGTYDLQWQMKKKDEAGRFGKPSPPVTVTVTP